MPKTRHDTDARPILPVPGLPKALAAPAPLPGDADPDFDQSADAASRRFRRISDRSTCS